LSWEIITLTLFAIYVIASVLLKISYKISIASGIVLLVVAAISLLIKEESLANNISILAFDFILIGLIISLLDQLRMR